MRRSRAERQILKMHGKARWRGIGAAQHKIRGDSKLIIEKRQRNVQTISQRTEHAKPKYGTPCSIHKVVSNKQVERSVDFLDHFFCAYNPGRTMQVSKIVHKKVEKNE